MSRSPNLRKRSQWLDRLRRFARSKRSVAEFCQREQVSVGSFYQWRRKLHDGSTDLSDRRPPTRESFVPVHVTAATDLQVTDGHLFLFVNRRGDRIKALWWEPGGLILWYKRLEQGTFEMPRASEGQSHITIDATQLAMLIGGVPLASAGKRRKRMDAA